MTLKQSIAAITLAGALSLVPVAVQAAAPVPAKTASQGSRGAKALKSSFYLNTVPTMVELVGEVKKEVLDSFELDPQRRAAAEKALAELWTEKRIYAHAATAIEKQLGPQVLDAAITQMTPEVQAMIKAGIGDASQEQAKAWLAAAQKHPEAKLREPLAQRIAAHMPQAGTFEELIAQVAEVLGDTAQITLGTDELRPQLRATLMEGLTPAIQAMGQKEAVVLSVLITYRDQPTAKMKRLADALDSEAGSKLQRAAGQALLAGAKQTRQDLVAQLQRDLKPGKKARAP